MKRLAVPYQNQFAFTGIVEGKPVDLGFCSYFCVRIEEDVQTDVGWITLHPKFKVDGRGESADKIMQLHDGDCVAVSGPIRNWKDKDNGRWNPLFLATHVEVLAKKGEKWNQ